MHKSPSTDQRGRGEEKQSQTDDRRPQCWHYALQKLDNFLNKQNIYLFFRYLTPRKRTQHNDAGSGVFCRRRKGMVRCCTRRSSSSATTYNNCNNKHNSSTTELLLCRFSLFFKLFHYFSNFFHYFSNILLLCL